MALQNQGNGWKSCIYLESETSSHKVFKKSEGSPEKEEKHNNFRK